VHVLVNLLKNAEEAMAENPLSGRSLRVSIGVDGEGRPTLSVADNGHGIATDNRERIFAHGFSTKTTGRGFGLHSCANSMTEMGGRLEVSSDGPGTGAAFTLVFGEPRSDQVT
jgi:C4-dicarboxylate-specific signal transduction histidine kinase